MKEKYTFEFLERYLDNSLTVEERNEFESDLHQDEELKSELKDHEDARLAVKAYTQIKTKEKVAELYTKASERGNVIQMNFKRIALAASIALLVGFGLTWLVVSQNYSNSGLVASNLEPYPDRITTMSSAPSTLLSDAMKEYNLGNYEASISKFSAIPDDDSNKLLANLYQGISELKSSDSAAAEESFTRVLQDGSQLTDVTNWYLALAKLEGGKDEEAKELLEAISESGGYQAENARKLLKKLNSGLRGLLF